MRQVRASNLTLGACLNHSLTICQCHAISWRGKFSSFNTEAQRVRSGNENSRRRGLPLTGLPVNNSPIIQNSNTRGNASKSGNSACWPVFCQLQVATVVIVKCRNLTKSTSKCTCRHKNTVNIVSFRTGRSGQTVQIHDQTAPRSSLIRVYTVCNSICSFWMQYSTVKPSCLNFRVITANFSGVLIFRIFTVSLH